MSETCPRCGIRSVVGCRHAPAAEPLPPLTTFNERSRSGGFAASRHPALDGTETEREARAARA